MDDINPVRGDFRVVVKIDKSFSREPIHFNACCSSKEFECVDFVVYDRKVLLFFCDLCSFFLGIFFHSFLPIAGDAHACPVADP